MSGLVRWNAENRSFEVHGRLVDVAEALEPASDWDEIARRLVDRRLVRLEQGDRDNWFAELDDGQIVEFEGLWFNTGDAGAAVRFWWPLRAVQSETEEASGG